jgi:diphthamide biosynthesis protein 3
MSCKHVDELLDGEDIARCPSCSLLLRVIYDEEALDKLAEAG